VVILGAEWRAPPLARLAPKLSLLLSRIAQHIGPPQAEIERTWQLASLKELDPPMQRLLLRPRQYKRDSMLPFHLWCI
jgi:hypothetical protein